MARKYTMSWEGSPYFRWVKMYKGTRYRISCTDLELPQVSWTKDESYHAANAWWEKKRAEIDGQDPRRKIVGELQRRVDYAERHGLHDESKKLRDDLEGVQEMFSADPEEVNSLVLSSGQIIAPDKEPGTIEDLQQSAAEMLAGVTIPPESREFLVNLFGGEKLWADRLKREKAAPAGKSIGALAEKWSAAHQEEARKGLRSSDGANNQRIILDHFVRFAGPTNAVDTITADLVHRWYVQCQGEVIKRDIDNAAGWSVAYARTVFAISRSFVKWLWEREHLSTIPRNLNSQQFRFERPESAIPTFEDSEIRSLLGKATGQHRLHLFLMLNIGCTQKDISDLRKDQIVYDGKNPVGIKRRRSKTVNKKNTPEVHYPLWPETARLLQEHLSADPVFALLTDKSKQRWVRKEILVDGKLKHADCIARLFQNLRKLVGLKGEGKSLKVFRKTSATRLKSHREYRSLVQFFLGHSAVTVADKHYAKESQELLAEAVGWLGKQYGLT